VGENKRPRLHSHWSEVAFAVAWIGALSVYWVHIKMNVHFQAILRWGIGLTFPVSLIYVTFIYIAAIAVILWAGLAIYLAVTGGFSLRRLFRGLLVIVLLTVPFPVAGIFLNGLLLPPVVRYMTLWLPLFLALWLSIWLGLPCRQRNGRFAPKAVE
jgi:hypothetical protein